MKAVLKRRDAYAHQHRHRRLRRRLLSLGASLTVLVAGSLTAASLADGKRKAETSGATTKVAGTSTVQTATQNKRPVSEKLSATSSTASPLTPPATPPETPLETCTPKQTTNAMLQNNSNPTLRKLATYDKLLCSGAISSSYIFVGLPRTNDEADEQARDIAIALQSFSASSIKPIVIVEPQFNGQKTDMAAFSSSATVGVFDYFLSQVKVRGISDAQAGTWVLLPEPNLPEWSTLDPTIFTTNFTSLGTMFKSYFPSARLGMLLDSMTYTQNSYATNGSRTSLLPYVNGVPSGLADVFILQGFPWTPPAGQDGAVLDASVYLKPSLATEASAALGVHDIWLNTGTFETFYANDSTKVVHASSAERQKILDSIVGQAKSVQKAGFDVGVMLFAEDKSATAEAKDWSYWHGDTVTMSDDGAKLFSVFADKLTGQHINLGVFDSY